MQIVKFFIERGCSIDIKDEQDETLLFKSIKGDSISVFKFLSQKGASLNSINKAGETIDHYVEISNNELIKNYYKNLKLDQQRVIYRTAQNNEYRNSEIVSTNESSKINSDIKKKVTNNNSKKVVKKIYISRDKRKRNINKQKSNFYNKNIASRHSQFISNHF